LTQPVPPHTRPNPFTALRLLLVPGLWLLAYWQQDVWLGLGLALAALTDVLDGRLARHDARYADGRFDSIADKVLTFSAVVWLVMRRPEIFRQHPWLILAATLLFGAVQLVSWIKFRRVSGLHTHLGKLGGLVQALFVVQALVVGGYSVGLLYAALGLFVLATAEELAILLTHAVINEEAVRSIVPYLRQRLKRA
jgi:phosphatidylglycerophosphate synthase